MTDPIPIPDDITAALGELTEKQHGTLSRLLQTVGEERTRELLG